MKSHEIFAQISPALASEIFGFLFEKEKPLYKATIESLATPRKLRPVFIERKPRDQRHAWMHEAIGKRSSDGVAAHLLQIWLVGQHSSMLSDFLDALGIAHDENGTVDELPACPPREDLEKAVNILLEKNDRESVAVYLHTFQALDDKGWDELAQILEQDERLKLG